MSRYVVMVRRDDLRAGKLAPMNENYYRGDGRSVGIATLPGEMGFKG